MRVYDSEDDLKTDGSSCSSIRNDLIYCINATDCVRLVCNQQRKTPRQCFAEKDASIPDECYRLRYLLFECKRSLVDCRIRFRGRKGYTGVDQ